MSWLSIESMREPQFVFINQHIHGLKRGALGYAPLQTHEFSNWHSLPERKGFQFGTRWAYGRTGRNELVVGILHIFLAGDSEK